MFSSNGFIVPGKNIRSNSGLFSIYYPCPYISKKNAPDGAFIWAPVFWSAFSCNHRTWLLMPTHSHEAILE